MHNALLLFTGCASKNLKIEKMISCATAPKEHWEDVNRAQMQSQWECTDVREGIVSLTVHHMERAR